jgi:pimeloyl-ACP methyl ester carboxylesterase
VKASLDWLAHSGAEFRPAHEHTGLAHLKHYSASYAEWGSGEPLILLPGLAGGFELLGPLARCLARHFRVIACQLRGEDDPFALRQRFKLNDLVNDVREFIDWLGLEAPALMGVSFGGILALEFATRFPMRLQRLIVQGAGCRFERGLLPQLAGQVLSSYPLPSDNAFVNQFFNLLFGGRQSATPIFDFVTRQCWQTDQSVMAHRFQLARRFDVTSRLERIRVPVLALAGERDLLVSPQSLADMETSINECRVVRLPGCGHLAFATQPERVAEETRRFLLDTDE